MGLFKKKSPCPICGGKIGWLLPTKIEGEYVCSDCVAKIDMQWEVQNSLTMQQFKEYLAYYEENKILKQQFVISQKIDFGLLDTKMIFDFENHLFCMSKNPDKTVFEGKDLVSFIIKEDNTPLFEGSADGIKRYQSTIPEKAMALTPQLVQYVTNRRMLESMERMSRDDNENRRRIPTMDIPEPFRKFNVELNFNHPYWHTIHCDMSGPTFSNDYPDVNDYLKRYNEDIAELDILVNAFKTVAFPNAPILNITSSGTGLGSINHPEQVYQQPTDTIEEIRKYKSLLEEGIISEEEFQSKKKQLLGI